MNPHLVTALGAIGLLAIGYVCGHAVASRRRRLAIEMEAVGPAAGRPAAGKKGSLEVERLAARYEDFKLVLVVRNDLKMGKGKIAAQCGHATLGLYKKISKRAPLSLSRWEDSGQVKVVVKVESLDEMLLIQDKAKTQGIPTHVTIDAGRTQIEPNSKTVMAVFGPEEIVQTLTGHLKLL